VRAVEAMDAKRLSDMPRWLVDEAAATLSVKEERPPGLKEQPSEAGTKPK
jgi:hypothetical protein